MNISPELADIVRDKLVYYQIITVPYGQGEFQRRALSLIKAIDEQRAKEAAERKEESREYDAHVAKIVAEERREDAIEAWEDFWNGRRRG